MKDYPSSKAFSVSVSGITCTRATTKPRKAIVWTPTPHQHQCHNYNNPLHNNQIENKLIEYIQNGMIGHGEMETERSQNQHWQLVTYCFQTLSGLIYVPNDNISVAPSYRFSRAHHTQKHLIVSPHMVWWTNAVIPEYSCAAKMWMIPFRGTASRTFYPGIGIYTAHNKITKELLVKEVIITREEKTNGMVFFSGNSFNKEMQDTLKVTLFK